MIVERESAVLGLTGSRETQVTLDSDHSGICKIGARGAMYELVGGNISNLVNKAVLISHGYMPPPSPQPGGPSPPPLPARAHSHGSVPYAAVPRIEPKITGYLYPPTGADPRSLQLAELKNVGCWDQVRAITKQIYGEHQRNAGPEHLDTLTSGYHLAVADSELNFVDSANRWASWVASTCQRLHGSRHPLFLKAESLRGHTLTDQGHIEQAHTTLADAFARQQNTLGDDHFDTLETQRNLAIARYAAGRKDDALARLKKRSENLSRLLGDNHIRVYASMLDLVEVMIPKLSENVRMATAFDPGLQRASQIMASIQPDIEGSLGTQHPLTIRALRLCGVVKATEGDTTEASDILRRALSNAEDALGEDHPETMAIVTMIASVYMVGAGALAGYRGGGSVEAVPFLKRYLSWVEQRNGPKNPDTRGTLRCLGGTYMSLKDFHEAQGYTERLAISYQGENSKEAEVANQMLDLCRMSTMIPSRSRRARGGDITSLLSSLKF